MQCLLRLIFLFHTPLIDILSFIALTLCTFVLFGNYGSAIMITFQFSYYRFIFALLMDSLFYLAAFYWCWLKQGWVSHYHCWWLKRRISIIIYEVIHRQREDTSSVRISWWRKMPKLALIIDLLLFKLLYFLVPPYLCYVPLEMMRRWFLSLCCILGCYLPCFRSPRSSLSFIIWVDFGRIFFFQVWLGCV